MKTAVAGMSRPRPRDTRKAGYCPYDDRRKANVALAKAPSHSHSFTVRSRRALVITLTEDRAMAAAAICGESSQPNTG